MAFGNMVLHELWKVYESLLPNDARVWFGVRDMNQSYNESLHEYLIHYQVIASFSQFNFFSIDCCGDTAKFECTCSQVSTNSLT